jgi:glycerol uptake facilitator-like aquaporin
MDRLAAAEPRQTSGVDAGTGAWTSVGNGSTVSKASDEPPFLRGSGASSSIAQRMSQERASFHSTLDDEIAFAGGLAPGFNDMSVDTPRDLSTGRFVLRNIIRSGRREIRTRAVYGAAVTEFNFTAIFMYMHIAIVRAAVATGPDGTMIFSSPPIVGGIGHFILIALCTFAGAGSGAHMNPNSAPSSCSEPHTRLVSSSCCHRRRRHGTLLTPRLDSLARDAVTVATMLIGLTTAWRTLMYILAQNLGAIFGVVLMRATLGWNDVTAADLAQCSRGTLMPDSAVVVEAAYFHVLLCVIGGVAFDPRQMKIFGPVLAPIFISAAVGLIVFSSMQIGNPGYGPMLNWAQCFSTSIVAGEFNGDEWISFVGPLLATIFHSVLHILVPPSHASTGRLRVPLLARNSGDIPVSPYAPSERYSAAGVEMQQGGSGR